MRSIFYKSLPLLRGIIYDHNQDMQKKRRNTHRLDVLFLARAVVGLYFIVFTITHFRDYVTVAIRKEIPSPMIFFNLKRETVH